MTTYAGAVEPLVAILRALSQAEVDFVVVGGVAVVLQGHPRLTADLDLVVDLEVENVRLALGVLQKAGLRPRLPVPAQDFADPNVRQAWIEERNLTVFSLHDPTDPLREVDIFADPPIPLHRLLGQASFVDIGGVTVPVASRRHLIEMKEAAGRPQDLADIAALWALEGEDDS